MLLAQREHSRAELARKLLPMALAEAHGGRAGAGARDASARARGGGGVVERGNDEGLATDADDGARRAAAAQRVEALLDWLEAHRYLSEARFVEGRVHARAARYGLRRIEHELAQHGVALDAATRARLRDDEYARAREVWARKYGMAPATPAERLRQMRFLAGRGFSPDVIRRVVRGTDEG